MKRLVVIALACILVVAASVSAQTPPAQPGAKEPAPAPLPSKAKLYMDNTEFQFGWIPANSTVSHAYWIHSRGEDSLKILNVKPG